MPTKQLLFYSPNEPFGFFSNFSRHPVEFEGATWMTSEHAFQAAKFKPHRPDLVQRVLKASTPTKAAEIGRDRSHPLRPDWDSRITRKQAHPEWFLVDDGRGPTLAAEKTKDWVMFDVCLAKFSQHPSLKEGILSTGDDALVENAIHDPYWGWGSSRTGVNRLGKVLMAVRNVLRFDPGYR